MERFHIALRLRGRIVRPSRSPAFRVRLFLGASLSVEPISNLRGRALEVPLGGNANEAQTQKRRHFGARKRAPHRVVLLCVPLFHAAFPGWRMEDGHNILSAMLYALGRLKGFLLSGIVPRYPGNRAKRRRLAMPSCHREKQMEVFTNPVQGWPHAPRLIAPNPPAAFCFHSIAHHYQLRSLM